MTNSKVPVASEVLDVAQETSKEETFQVEIITQIAENLAKDGHSKTLAALAATSKNNYDAVLPLLYRRISLNDTSVKLFHRLHDEIVQTAPLTEVDRVFLRPLRNPDEVTTGTDDIEPRTSAIERFAMVESIVVDGGLEAAVRTKHGNPDEKKPKYAETGIPVLCPNLRSIVFPEAFIESSQRKDKECTEDEQTTRIHAMIDACQALEALLQPRTTVLHLPEYDTPDNCDASDSLCILICCFAAYELRQRSVVLYNAKSVPMACLSGSGDVHFCIPKDADNKIRCYAAMEALVYTLRWEVDFTGRIIMHDSLSAANSLQGVDDYPYDSLAESLFPEGAAKVVGKHRRTPEGFSDTDLDKPELLGFNSRFLEAIWSLARAIEENRNQWEEDPAESNGIRTWMNWRNLAFPYGELHTSMKTRFAVVGAITGNEFDVEAMVPDMDTYDGDGYWTDGSDESM